MLLCRNGSNSDRHLYQTLVEENFCYTSGGLQMRIKSDVMTRFSLYTIATDVLFYSY